MTRPVLYALVLVLAVALVAVGIYAYQQAQRPAVEVRLDGSGLSINGKR